MDNTKRKPKSRCPYYVPDESCENIVCKPNQYPGYLEKAVPISIVGTDTGNYMSLHKLLSSSLTCADRSLFMTPWGNYVILKSLFKTTKPSEPNQERRTYFLYDGCTCNANIFRYLDLREGTAGFLTFCTINSLVRYIMNSRYKREKLRLISKQVLDDICIQKRPTGEDESHGDQEKTK